MTEETIDCDYCNEDFHGERPHLKHLNKKHYDELGTIDRRRVDEKVNTSTKTTTTLKNNIGIIVIGALVVVAGLALYASFTANTSSDVSDGLQEPGPQGTIHEHTTFDVTVDGESIDFSQSQYQVSDGKVHFEGGNGDSLHLHARGVTIAYTLETLGFTVTDNGDTVEFEGTTYSTADGDTVQYEVNGDSVNATTYELQANDRINVVLETEE